jgi:hypothetical protein
MKELRTLAIAAMTVVCALATAASPQTAPDNKSKPAANAWMLTPTPYLEWNKDISPSLREERDRFWDDLSPREFPLTVKQGHGGGFGGPDYWDDGKQPEIPDVLDRAVLTATFSAHRSVLSASEKSIYTEITMRVQQVFEDKTGSSHLAPHKDITLMLNGGTVALRSGRILSDSVKPCELSPQPERSYLLVLQHQKEGDWYELIEDWDITDGIVRANTGWGQYLAKHGRSRLNGLPVEQLGAVLSEELYVHN